MKIISVVGARPGMMAPQQPRMGVPAGKTTHTHQTANPFGKISVVIAAEPDLREGTVKRAPNWILSLHLEWLYRLMKQPKHMLKRYKQLPFTTLIFDSLKYKFHERFN